MDPLQQQDQPPPPSKTTTATSSSSTAATKQKKKEELFITNEDLSQMLKSLDSFQPVIPNHIIKHYLATSGVDTTDESM
eukprot:m.86981 g.86981  ORF g.86981 m.86981 type:complete len:79 (+) comp12228_c1_seq1:129-365(+)